MTSQGPTLPKPNQRSLIVGRTGSGKTVFGLFLLGQQNFNEKAWIVIDFKGDEQIAQIQNTKPISWHTNVATLTPGIYILRMDVNQQAELETFLWNVYNSENVGLFVDEGYMIGQGSRYSPAFRTLLTQGRSKNIGIIINSQRPVWLDVFSKSEANRIIMFHLNAEKDRKTMAEFMGDDLGPDVNQRLDTYHSIYYDIDANRAIELGPVPSPDESLSLINRRLGVIRQTKDIAPIVTKQINPEWNFV